MSTILFSERSYFNHHKFSKRSFHWEINCYSFLKIHSLDFPSVQSIFEYRKSVMSLGWSFTNNSQKRRFLYPTLMGNTPVTFSGNLASLGISQFYKPIPYVQLFGFSKLFFLEKLQLYSYKNLYSLGSHHRDFRWHWISLGNLQSPIFNTSSDSSRTV